MLIGNYNLCRIDGTANHFYLTFNLYNYLIKLIQHHNNIKKQYELTFSKQSWLWSFIAFLSLRLQLSIQEEEFANAQDNLKQINAGAYLEILCGWSANI